MKRTVRWWCTPSSALGVPSGLKQGRPLARWGRRKKAQPAVRSACVRHVCGTGCSLKPACLPLSRESPPWLRRGDAVACLGRVYGMHPSDGSGWQGFPCHAPPPTLCPSPAPTRRGSTRHRSWQAAAHSTREGAGELQCRAAHNHILLTTAASQRAKRSTGEPAVRLCRCRYHCRLRALDSQHRGSFLLCPRAAGRHPARKGTRRS